MLVVRVGPRSFHGFNQKPSSKWDDRLVQLWEDVDETARVLKRLGYITYQVHPPLPSPTPTPTPLVSHPLMHL